jgi:hypothetical protein
MRDWKSAWVPAIFKEADRVCQAPGWNPKIVRLEGNTVMVDLAMHHDDMMGLPHSINVIEWIDHPFLATLPSNAPRAVRSIYTKDMRLAYLRATDAWRFIDDMNKAEAAWTKYTENEAARATLTDATG